MSTIKRVQDVRELSVKKSVLAQESLMSSGGARSQYMMNPSANFAIHNAKSVVNQMLIENPTINETKKDARRHSLYQGRELLAFR
jgi:hypothetical protein